jgi:hypothetical protein
VNAKRQTRTVPVLNSIIFITGTSASSTAGFIWTLNWLLASRDEGAPREGRRRGAGWLGWAYLAKKVPHAATTPIVTAFKTCISHRKNGLLNRLPAKKLVFRFLTRFLYREVTSPQPAWAPKTRFGGKTFYFVRKTSGGIPEAAGAFCIEQRTSTKTLGGSKLATPRCGLLTHCFGQIGPTQPYCRGGGAFLPSPQAATNRPQNLKILIFVSGC